MTTPAQAPCHSSGDRRCPTSPVLRQGVQKIIAGPRKDMDIMGLGMADGAGIAISASGGEGFRGANERAHEFAVDFGTDSVRVEPLVGEE